MRNIEKNHPNRQINTLPEANHSYPEDGGSRFFQNVVTSLLKYVGSNPRRHYSSTLTHSR
jgi:hypothetical protein